MRLTEVSIFFKTDVNFLDYHLLVDLAAHRSPISCLSPYTIKVCSLDRTLVISLVYLLNRRGLYLLFF